MHDLAVSGDVTCAQAPKLLAGFLQDWDGRLPSPWKVVAADGEFLRGSTGDGIRVSAAKAPPTPGPPSGDACPYFTVLSDDRIGTLTLKAGRYTMRLLSGRLDLRPGGPRLPRLPLRHERPAVPVDGRRRRSSTT